MSRITHELESIARGEGSSVGTGGMYSKLLAAKRANSYGIRVNIVSGRKSGVISSLLAGKELGTEFIPNTKKYPLKRDGLLMRQSRGGLLFLTKEP